MYVFKSKSSGFVKVATISAMLVLTLDVASLVRLDENYGMIGGVILGTIILGTLIYFYANSLDKIILEKDGIVLKRNIGEIHIPKFDILEVHKLGYSNLTMTYGSKGVFGFIGNTMDDSISLVKDRKQMLRITTKNKKYIVSSENPDALVDHMKPFTIFDK